MSRLPQFGSMAMAVLELEDIDKNTTLNDLYAALRHSGALHVACKEHDPETIFLSSFRSVFEIGHRSLPVALAVVMHMYVLGAFATFPLPRLDKFAFVRRGLLKRVAAERLIIANTGGASLHLDQRKRVLTPAADGYRLTGRGGMMSLAGIAQYVLVEAAFEDEAQTALCIVDLSAEGIRLGAPATFGTMQESRTATIEFENCLVPTDRVFRSTQKGDADTLRTFQRAWFQGLAPAAYLGALQAVLGDAARMAHVTSTRDGSGLDELDGFRERLGSLVIKMKAAIQLCERTGAALASFDPRDQQSMVDLHDVSAVAKYTSTHAAEEAVPLLKKYLGTRTFGSERLTRAMTEMLYGGLHPMSDFEMERHFATTFLAGHGEERDKDAAQ